MFDAFDQDGQLARVMFYTTTPMYDLAIPWSVKNVVYDFSRGLYAYLNDGTPGGLSDQTERAASGTQPRNRGCARKLALTSAAQPGPLLILINIRAEGPPG